MVKQVKSLHLDRNETLGKWFGQCIPGVPMKRIAFTLAALIVSGLPAQAQFWSPWDDLFPRPYRYERSPQPPQRAVRPPADRQMNGPPGGVWNGGGQPDIAPQAPPIVPFTANYPADSIVIDSGGRMLYYVLPGRRAYQYRISVGREGFSWTGSEKISRKQAWPDWHPPAEMRQRDPSLPVKMTGGLKNPLGAMALYLGSTLYRIHGTNDPGSIGRASSSGCFRMMNANVVHLASLAKVGTTVTVVRGLAQPSYQVSTIRGEAPPRGFRDAPPRLPLSAYDPDEDDDEPLYRPIPRGYRYYGR